MANGAPNAVRRAVQSMPLLQQVYQANNIHTIRLLVVPLAVAMCCVLYTLYTRRAHHFNFETRAHATTYSVHTTLK